MVDRIDMAEFVFSFILYYNQERLERKQGIFVFPSSSGRIVFKTRCPSHQPGSQQRHTLAASSPGGNEGLKT